MRNGIKRVVRFGKYYRLQQLEGKGFIILAICNAGIVVWNLFSPWPYKLFSIFSVAALILSIIMLIKANIVTMPDWAKDVWEDPS